jgi:hypothetical protein
MNPDTPRTHSLRVHHVDGRLCWVGIIPGPVGASTTRMPLNPTVY